MLIGLYGDSRAGKDSTARIISDYKNYEWRVFASTLRQILLDINPYLPEIHRHLRSAVVENGWDVVKGLSESSVDMMIALGQSARDLIDPDIWIIPILSGVDPSENIVISDVRQENEYNAVTALRGEVWRIVRPGTKRRGMDGLLDHCDFPVTIHNNGSLADLETIVKKEMDALSNRRN